MHAKKFYLRMHNVTCWGFFERNIRQDLQLKLNLNFFHDRGSYHIETSPLLCSANQWTGFYMKGTSVMKDIMRQLLQWCPRRYLNVMVLLVTGLSYS